MSNSKRVALVSTLDTEKEWIKFAFQDIKPKWYIIISQNTTIKVDSNSDHENLNQIDSENQNIDIAIQIVKEIEELMADWPVTEKTNVSILKTPDDHDQPETIIPFFLSLLQLLVKQEYRIMINLTSGNMHWSLACYIASIFYRENIDELFIYNIKSGIRQTYWIYRSLNVPEADILSYLSEKYPEKITPSYLQDIYVKNHDQGQLPFISKILNSLQEDK